MNIDLSALQPYLIVLLPVFLPLFSSSLAALLAQSGFPKAVNDLLAWIALLAATIASVYAAGELTGDANAIIPAAIGTATLLVHGSLYQLGPYLKYLDALQSLSVVKPKPASAPAPLPSAQGTAPAPASASSISQMPTAPQPIVQYSDGGVTYQNVPPQPVPISEQSTLVTPVVNAPISQYPTAQVPAVDPASFPPLTFDLSQGG